MSVEVANESGVDVDETGLAGLARHVLDSMRINPLAELSILLVDEDEMSRLHERWMDESGPTDVLAFPMDELAAGRVDVDARAAQADPVPALLGDVVLCPAVAQRQAATAGHTTRDELNLLCTHGILHLLGYDHAEPDEHREMFALQTKLLGTWLAAGFGRA